MRMLMSHVHCNEIKFEVQEAKRLMSVRTTHLIYELEKETSTVCTMFWHVHVPVSRFQLVQISRKGGMNFLCRRGCCRRNSWNTGFKKSKHL